MLHRRKPVDRATVEIRVRHARIEAVGALFVRREDIDEGGRIERRHLLARAQHVEREAHVGVRQRARLRGQAAFGHLLEHVKGVREMLEIERQKRELHDLYGGRERLDLAQEQRIAEPDHRAAALTERRAKRFDPERPVDEIGEDESLLAEPAAEIAEQRLPLVERHELRFGHDRDGVVVQEAAAAHQDLEFGPLRIEEDRRGRCDRRVREQVQRVERAQLDGHVAHAAHRLRVRVIFAQVPVRPTEGTIGREQRRRERVVVQVKRRRPVAIGETKWKDPATGRIVPFFHLRDRALIRVEEYVEDVGLKVAREEQRRHAVAATNLVDADTGVRGHQ